MHKNLKLAAMVLGMLLSVFFTIDLFVFPLVQGKFSRKIIMPDLRDLDSAAAVKLLGENGITVGEVGSAYHEDVPFGYVISQMPFPGQIIKRQRRVRFTLSLGQELVMVPELKELSPSQASDTLQRLGLRLGKTRESYGERMTPGAIIASSPPAGSSMPKGGVVDITISQSSLTGKTYIPDFTDMSFQAAKHLRAKLHLRIREATTRKDPELLPGTVMEQSIKAGTRVDRGTHIDFVVSE